MAAKSPAQIIAVAQSALRSANGVVIAGYLSQNGRRVQLKIVDDGPSKREIEFSVGGKSAEIIATPGAGYVRANQAFWSAQAGASAASLANRWIELAPSTSQQLTASFGRLAPGTLASCLGENLGALSRGGTTSIAGRPAVVIREASNVPGSAPGTVAVATSGPAYPLRVTSTGPTRPGGKVDMCNSGKGGNTEGVLTLSDFDHAPVISTPKNAVKLNSAST